MTFANNYQSKQMPKFENRKRFLLNGLASSENRRPGPVCFMLRLL